MLMTRNITLASCCCLLASITLLQYAATSERTQQTMIECICGATIKDLIDEDGKAVCGTHGTGDTVPWQLPPKVDEPALA